MRYDLEFVNIPNSIHQVSAKYADMLAIVDDGLEWDYAELDRQMLRAIRAAMAWGIKPGDRIGVYSTNSARFILAALAIQGAGGIMIPLNTRFKPDEIAYILERGGASGLIAEAPLQGRHYVEALRESAPDLEAIKHVITIDDLDLEDCTTWTDFLALSDQVSEADALASIEAIKPDDVSDVLFTSGTTGYPKGVPFTHAQSLRGYGDIGTRFGYGAGDKLLLIPPFFHALGYKSGWFAALLKGSVVLPERVFDSLHMIERIQNEKVTMMIGPPTVFNDLLNMANRDDFDISSLRLVIPASSNVSNELMVRMREELGIAHVITGYGLTEASASVSCVSFDDDPAVAGDSSGRPLPGVEVTVVDELGNPVPTGEKGELLVSGYVVMSGYWDDPNATAETIDPQGRLRTGDIGTVDANGFVRVTGRKKDIIIVGGFNAYPAEIERVLMQYPGIAEVAVVGVPDERMGEVVCAFVVELPGQPLDREALVVWAKDKMANFKVPRYVEILSALPKNPSMKVLKNELRELGAKSTQG
ncbi:MAG: long-chain fatty acid--CoA ligase [Nocardioidaceae bacterium]|nr:long-chain fatty acid--CoA ligase [Nocardioidaceae bacterium]